MQVHHLHSLQDGGDHALYNLRSLCRECHLDAHRQPKTPEQQEWAKLISELMK